MSLSQALKSAKPLRSTASGRSAGGKEGEEDGESSINTANNHNHESLWSAVQTERDQNERLRAVDLESWYGRLMQEGNRFTFETVFVPLNPDEAQAMIDEYWERKDGKSGGAAKNRGNLDSRAALLDRLEQRIAAAIPELVRGSSANDGEPSPPAVFAKLSSRSPKDSRMCEERALTQVKERLSDLRAREGDGAIDTNSVLAAVMHCGIASLKLGSAKEVLDCFLTSDRVCEDDLPLALGFPDRWSQHVVLRRWVDIPSYCEFRGFVFGGKLTALSQYFSGVLFPELVQNRELIERMICEFFEMVAPYVGMDEYVIDLAVDLPNQRVFVIELNPFGKPDGMGTGTVLFNTALSDDRAILFGEASFEFRIETERNVAPMRTLLREGPLERWLVEQGLLA